MASDLPCSVEDVDVIEPRRGAPCETALIWGGWPFPSKKEPPTGNRGGRTTGGGVPELLGVGLVGDVAQHAGELAAPDLVEHLPAELEVVALLVDRIGGIAHDVDAPVHPAIIWAGVIGASPSSSDTLGIRWNCTLLQLSA